MTERDRSRRTLRLADLAGIVVGYGLAALLIKAFWHSPELPSMETGAVIGFVYLWLGLAMSGPVVLLLDRRAAPKEHPPKRLRIGRPLARSEAGEKPGEQGPQAGASSSEARPRYTRAELAWLSIGAYWIGMTLLVVPARLHDTPLALVAVLQALLGLGLWVIGPRGQAPEEDQQASWTHRVSIGVVVSWPAAWIALILLSKSL
jgi:hypothetical protein